MLRGFLKIACIGKGINRAVGAAVTFLFTHHLVKNMKQIDALLNTNMSWKTERKPYRQKMISKKQQNRTKMASHPTTLSQ